VSEPEFYSVETYGFAALKVKHGTIIPGKSKATAILNQEEKDQFNAKIARKFKLCRTNYCQIAKKVD
jgi:hypothetical protein